MPDATPEQLLPVTRNTSESNANEVRDLPCEEKQREKSGLWARLLVKECENNRSSSSADQLSRILFAEQIACHLVEQGGKLGFLFWRPAVKQIGQVVMKGGRQSLERFLPGRGQLELSLALTIGRCHQRDQPLLAQCFN